MKNSVLDRLKSYFDEYFSGATRPTARNLFLIVVSILALDIFRSVRFAHRHVLSRLSDTSLNAYYYALRTDSLDHGSWRGVTVSKALRTVPDQLKGQPFFLSIDDTMVEKEGDKFELCSRLFDHAAHNGSNYLNGHCMVSTLLSFPVMAGGSIRYLSVPLGYQLWDREQTKLEIAAGMVRCAMDRIGPDRQVFLLCDSWYPKGCVAGLVNEFHNLDIICNARIDTVMYDLPPERTGKRGRPKKYGRRLSPEDFELESPKTGDWKIGVRPVLTNLWGERVVYAIVTLPKSGNGSRRLFFCTRDPEGIILDYGSCEDETIRGYGEEGKKFLPIACYSPRWNIEVSYYESETFCYTTAMKVGRRYCSISGKDSVFGRGWSFPYASRIYRDTGDMVQPRIHLEAVTGHSLCFEKQGDRWISQCRGTGRFSMEVRDGEGFPEKETFLLTDVVEHTLSAYDRQGRLSYVEYPNGIRTVLAYGEEGLEQIVTPVGNVLEVVCEEGHILQITDEIGRRTQYKYKDGCLTDVVHTDEGITHYEYDEGGRIKSVTDQNGSRYLENEYDEKGRIVRQCFASGVYQTFAYDDAHRRNTVYFSESGKREVYEYNDQLLVERTVYDDSTAVTCTYSEDNMKTSETSRQGHRKEWEYDGFGRVVLEKSPDGYQVCHEYDGNHDLVRTWDTDGCEALLTYDSAHNLILLREKISEGRWRETSKAYDSMGRCIRERDALGNETIMEYGSSTVHPVRVITPKGEETTCEYDAVGRRMTYANVYGTVEFTYNSRNLITKRIDGEGHEAHWFYDQMGRLRRYYPPEQWRKQAGCYTYHYDFMQRLEDTITPLEEHQRVFRNFDGNIIRQIHPVSYALKGESGEGIWYEYDHDGNCIRIHYPDGGVERRFYDADGNIIKQIPPESYVAADDDGEGTTYGYDACGRLSVVKDRDGSILKTYEYDGHGNLVREVDGEGGEKLYYYNGLGLKIREEVQVRKEGEAFYRVVTYAYDNQGNKVEEAYGCQETVRGGSPEAWHSIHFSYDSNNRLVSIKDDYGAQEKYDYDCLGKKITEERIIEEGTYQKIQYKYDRNGRRIGKQEEIQGNGSVKIAVTTYGYDGNGNLVSVRTPKGFLFHREYDGDDRLLIEHITDKRNGIDCSVIYSYNEIGKIMNMEVRGRGDEGGKTSFRYDLKDRMTHQINTSGAAVRYIYNKNDQITTRICPYGYDERTDSGIGTSYSYDSRGNCTSITNALGEKIEEAHYNLCNHLDMSMDALGNMTTYEYRLDGRVSTISRDYGGYKRTLQQYEYNARGQIVGIIDGNQERVSYDTDGWGKITCIGYSDGVEETYRYIPAGQACTAVDGNGNQVQYLYNSMGKVRERIDQLGERETFLYDAEGNLSLHIDRDGRKISRDYNVFGDPVYERAVDADGENVCISTWHYDSIGRIIRAVCNGHSYEYRYDSYGNLQEKCSNGSLLVSYAYDKAGQVKEIKDRNGICTLYGYDVLGRKERIYNNQGLDIRYSYDSQNRLQKIVYGNGVETHYTYDGDGNIGSLETKTADCILLSLRYQYDGNGNRTAKKGIRHELARTMEPKADEAINDFYRYNIRGQLLEEGNGNDVISYAYDAAGNRIRKTDAHGETYYAFNRKNQLVCMEGPKGITRYIYDKEGGITAEENPEGTRRYSYNSLHQQIWVCTEDGNVQENRYDAEGLRYEMSENGKQHRFIYHDQELLSEQTEGGGWTSYHLGGLGIDAACQDNKLLYYHKDEQNSTAYLTDGEGKAVNSYQYDAFGDCKEVTEKLFNRIRYAGQQYDCNTKQYYLRARYYSPAVGRFMQEDAYWGDGLNLYAYCNNNPVVYYDPSGYGLQEYLDVLAVWKDDIIEYWGKGFYSTYKERMRRTPAGQYKKSGAVKGNWEGDRGESMYSAFDYSDTAIRANQVIYQYGQKGITYSNGEPNFRPVSEAVVSIGNMMGDRYAEDGNFSQADKALAKYLNENPNCDLYEKMGVSGTVTEKDIKQYRKDNNLTWHEENDGVHMDLVSKDVNAIYGHLGGTAEQKRKEDGIEYNVEEDC